MKVKVEKLLQCRLWIHIRIHSPNQLFPFKVPPLLHLCYGGKVEKIPVRFMEASNAPED